MAFAMSFGGICTTRELLPTLFFKDGLSQYIRCTSVTGTDEMKCLVIRGTNFFMNTKTRFFGAGSRNHLSLSFEYAE